MAKKEAGKESSFKFDIDSFNKRIDSILQEADKSREKHSREAIVQNILKNKRKPSKVIRDPIHGIIKIDDQIVLRILDTKPVQRLRRIKQLGTTNIVYPSAEHTRFVHSLGVYHLSKILINKIENSSFNNRIDEYDKLVVSLSALLHDVGHGPFSHLFEIVLKKIKYKYFVKHEEWSKRIITNDPGISVILNEYGQSLKKDIVDSITTIYKPDILSSIISSQFDVDRFDYMLRDSYMTGVFYGKFDIDWILHSLTLVEINHSDKNEVKFSIDARRGLSSLEHYLLGNLNLYQHVYFHKTCLSANVMIESILHRALYLLKNGDNIGIKNTALDKICKDEELEISDYLSLTDSVFYTWFDYWANEGNDKILKDLSSRFIHRNLFKSKDVTSMDKESYIELKERIEKKLIEKDLNPEFYLKFANPDRTVYNPVLEKEIYITKTTGDTIPYSRIIEDDGHEISKEIIRKTKYKIELLCYPREIDIN